MEQGMTGPSQFFRDASGEFSMARLLCFLSFFPATWVLFEIPSEGTLGIYLGTFAISYLGGKGIDAIATVKTNKGNPA